MDTAELCNYEVCEKIWRGSPATEQLDMGMKTEDINQHIGRDEKRKLM